MGLGLLSGHLVRAQHGLDPVPHLGGDEWLVQSVVAGSPEGDLSFVVEVGKHPVDGGECRRFGGSFRGGRGGQAPVDEMEKHRRRMRRCWPIT